MCTGITRVFFFNDTATTEIYTLSLHDALPICKPLWKLLVDMSPEELVSCVDFRYITDALTHEEALEILRNNERSEEHTSELQSRQYLVCRLLLEKKK